MFPCQSRWYCRWKRTRHTHLMQLNKGKLPYICKKQGELTFLELTVISSVVGRTHLEAVDKRAADLHWSGARCIRACPDLHPLFQSFGHGFLCCPSDGKGLPLLERPLAIVYECGPWTGCQLGAACPQSVTQRVSTPTCHVDRVGLLDQPHAHSL